MLRTVIVLLYVVILAGGAYVVRQTHALRAPWTVDDNGIALVARHPLRRNQLLRASDVQISNAVPALLRRYAAPAPSSKYLRFDRRAGDLVRTRDLSDQPAFAPKLHHTYVSMKIDPFTASLLIPGNRIEFRQGTNAVFSSCVAAVLPQAVIFAVPDGLLDKVATKQQRVIYVLGGRRCL